MPGSTKGKSLRVRLTFPPELVKEPVVFTMAKKFDIVPNIRRARVTENAGEMILELHGAEGELQKGLEFLKGKGVLIDMVEGDVLQ